MISILQLTSTLEELLNKDTSYLDNNIIKNVYYKFNIVDDVSLFKKAEIEENKTIKYINGIVSINNSINDGINLSDYCGTIGTSIDFLIPDIDVRDENGQSVAAKRFREFFEKKLQFNQTFSIDLQTDDVLNPVVNYYVTADYSMPTTGINDIMNEVGEAINFTIEANFTIIVNGVSSDDIKIYYVEPIDDTTVKLSRIYPEKLNITRKTSITGNVYSNSTNGASKSKINSTTLAISLTLILRNNTICNKLLEYCINGATTPFKLRIAKGDREFENDIDVIFESATVNAEIPYAASANCTLVEYGG